MKELKANTLSTKRHIVKLVILFSLLCLVLFMIVNSQAQGKGLEECSAGICVEDSGVLVVAGNQEVQNAEDSDAPILTEEQKYMQRKENDAIAILILFIAAVIYIRVFYIPLI